MKKSVLCVLAFLSINAFAYLHERDLRGGTTDIQSRAFDCDPSNERIFMEFNNIRAVVETGGFLWENRAIGGPGYEYPKGSNSFLIFSGALWMGGEDVNGQLKIAAHRFRTGTDFWAGPLKGLIEGSGNYDPFVPQNADNVLVKDHGSAIIDKAECAQWDDFFSIKRKEVLDFIAWWECQNEITDSDDCDEIPALDEEVYDRIKNWPAHGDPSIGQDYYLAPFYDRDGSGHYNPEEGGDYPWYDIEEEVECQRDRRVTLFGDETHWWVFNDRGNIHTETNGRSIGMEVRAQAFSFATDDEINDMTFYNYELINRGTTKLERTYFGQYVDADVGDPFNDYVGCDVSRGLGFAYNSELSDEGGPGQTPYGSNPPAVGVDFFEGPYQDNDGIDNPIYIEDSIPLAQVYAQNGIPYAGLGIGYGDGFVDNERFGMQRFVYYNNSDGSNGDPESPGDYYNYLNGVWKNNQPMFWGGNGFTPGETSGIPTKFMFPGDSDPLGWSTYPTALPSSEPWSEITAGNEGGDRRFVQSAGPFTLQPGAVNNITVGVVIGEGDDSDLEAPLRALREADSKAQALFDNCFKILNPPPAPVLEIQEMENELVLFLSDPAGPSKLEDYEEEDGINIITPDELIKQGIFYDRFYRFEGFQIYQMVDEIASVSDIGNLSKARLVAQCDVINGVGKLVNYTFDEEAEISIPEVMVEPASGHELDQGIRRSFRVTEDLFATGNRTLVNHKKYYYLAVSYAHNEFKKYDPEDPNQLDGQRMPYLRSRLSANGGSIESVVGIPHDPSPEADGRVFTTSYGFQPEITQIEGVGNGGAFLELTQSTIDEILASNVVDHPTYQAGAGPIDVKVIDPLTLKGGDYTLGFTNTVDEFNENGWWMTRQYTDEAGNVTIDTVKSQKQIAVDREQLILDWGLSVRVRQKYYEGVTTTSFTTPIGATLDNVDSSRAWLDFVHDDDSFYPTNWIRSGGTTTEHDPETDPNPDCIAENWIYQPCHYDDWTMDQEEQLYEQLLEGGIAPFRLVGKGPYGSPYGFPGEETETPWYESNESWFRTGAGTAQIFARFDYLHDVDIYITSDKSKWTRCPVIEINDNLAQTEHGDWILQPRSDKSVDKNGLAEGETGPNGEVYNPEEGGLVNETGMGWFPGYAVDVNTGTRLNMMFSENSWLKGENGDDMIWNPTSNFIDNSGVPLFGGMHYVYVFGADVGGEEVIGEYDQGEALRTEFARFDEAGEERDVNELRASYRNAWKTCYWVMEPMLAQNQELLATDVKISTRINIPYAEREVNSENNGFPLYQFSFDNPSVIGDGNRLVSVIDNINVVPNPYYAYSEYESSKLDNRVKITNLPERCKINIFSLNGALVRAYQKDDPLTSIDWDLKNHKGIPIAGGIYFIHIAIEVENEDGIVTEHEKVLKWYGGLRQPDLDNL